MDTRIIFYLYYRLKTPLEENWHKIMKTKLNPRTLRKTDYITDISYLIMRTIHPKPYDTLSYII